jgi:hypothetical protein
MIEDDSQGKGLRQAGLNAATQFDGHQRVHAHLEQTALWVQVMCLRMAQDFTGGTLNMVYQEGHSVSSFGFIEPLPEVGR